jgi:hypothetical protein
MKQFRMEWDSPSPSELPWQHNFEVGSERIAVDYTRRHAARLGKNLHLWDMTVEGGRYVCSFLVGDPTVSVEFIKDMKG